MDSSPKRRPVATAVALAVAGLTAAGLSWAAMAEDTPSPGAAPSTSTQEARADSLVGRWIESLGGMETFHDFRSARYTLTTEMYDAESGRLQRTRPRYVTLAKTEDEELSRIERWHWDGSSFVVQAFDGDSAWAYVNGEPAPPDHQDAEEALYVSRDVFYWFSLPYKLRDPGVNLHYEGEDEEGRQVVRVTFGEGVGEHQDIWWYLFDEDRSWPVEVRYQTDGTGGVSRLRWEGIRSVDGYFYPVERVHLDSNDRVWKILRITDVEMNPDVPPQTFTDPAASPWTAGG